jgi:DNA-binding response OmpR family regulator
LSNVLLLTSGPEPPAEILPSLTLLPHAVRIAPAATAALTAAPQPDAVLVDARRDLVAARRLVQTLRGTDRSFPVLVIVTEGGWAAVSADWGADDVVLHTAGPGEVEARLRLALGRAAGPAPEASGEIRSGELVINEATYSARMHGRSLDLTFKEFELLKFLTQQPGRVFSRAQLLQEVWGYDYFGGTRTVDVHVRRLRAKLGAENESLIGTVRNVGYRFVPAKGGRGRSRAAEADADMDAAADPSGADGPADPGLRDLAPEASGQQDSGQQPSGQHSGGDHRSGGTGPHAARRPDADGKLSAEGKASADRKRRARA